MEKEIKEKLVELVALMNDPETTVVATEVKEKLEKILALVNNPDAIISEEQTKEKLEKVVALVDNMMVDPDIDIEYCIPEVATTSDSCDISGDPYISVTYVVGEYTKPTRKIRLTKTYLNNTAEEIANLITFSIEQFKTEIDSVEMG
ncbi:hypothetical protein [Sulfurovum sp.]|uniref:hypothetical protein n=1 Tax=Sulfurovum sp. TaxID=1969726 RepID=UPI002867D962|nr:hypothetical protein [Sulfurovum sp.]